MMMGDNDGNVHDGDADGDDYNDDDEEFCHVCEDVTYDDVGDRYDASQAQADRPNPQTAGRRQHREGRDLA